MMSALVYSSGEQAACEEVILGMGGVAMLRALGFEAMHSYHERRPLRTVDPCVA